MRWLRRKPKVREHTKLDRSHWDADLAAYQASATQAADKEPADRQQATGGPIADGGWFLVAENGYELPRR